MFQTGQDSYLGKYNLSILVIKSVSALLLNEWTNSLVYLLSCGLKSVNQLWYTDGIKITPLTVIITKPTSSWEILINSHPDFFCYILMSSWTPEHRFYSNTIKGANRETRMSYSLYSKVYVVFLWTEQNQKWSYQFKRTRINQSKFTVFLLFWNENVLKLKPPMFKSLQLSLT